MNRIMKICLIMLLLSCLLVVGGCDKKVGTKEKESNETVATKLVNEFNEIAKNEKNISKIATLISESKTLDIATVVVPVEEEGFLDGFDGELKGFEKASAIKPMVSSQPFIAYVFKTKDADELINNLKDHANKRWNICTEADEMEISVSGDYVFFVMSPTSFDE